MSESNRGTRREFLATSTAAAAAAWSSNAGAFAKGNDLIKVGLIGCGGRGTGAARQALLADKNVKLTAMGDAFQDRLDLSLRTLQENEDVAGKVDVAPEQRFVGFDAYKQVIENVDVVLLTTPPHFRPMHMRAAIDAGKHVFAEKPVAVDAPGVRHVLETCELAKKKGLSVVSGLCLRYDKGFQETVDRIHNGAIGEIGMLQAIDYRGTIWMKPRQPDWTDMHWQIRNWYYFTWLSGDFNVEQHVHYLDACAWVKDAYPVSAIGMGGREVRKGEEFGNIYDHHSVTYEFADGAKLFSDTRQQSGCFNKMSSNCTGTKGTAIVSESRHVISNGTDEWKYRGKHKNMYEVEHDQLFAGIRSGKPLNNGEYMAKSTLLAIMGRMATYTGKKITWDQALNSKESLGPRELAWGDVPMPDVAIPGVTKFV